MSDKEKTATEEMGDALVGAVIAVQAVRKAGRRKVVGLAKDAVHTAERVLGALADF